MRFFLFGIMLLIANLSYAQLACPPYYCGHMYYVQGSTANYVLPNGRPLIGSSTQSITGVACTPSCNYTPFFSGASISSTQYYYGAMLTDDNVTYSGNKFNYQYDPLYIKDLYKCAISTNNTSGCQPNVDYKIAIQFHQQFIVEWLQENNTTTESRYGQFFWLGILLMIVFLIGVMI